MLCNKHWERMLSLCHEVALSKTMVADAEAHANGSDLPSRNVQFGYRSEADPCGSCEAAHDAGSNVATCFEPGRRRAICGAPSWSIGP